MKASTERDTKKVSANAPLAGVATGATPSINTTEEKAVKPAVNREAIPATEKASNPSPKNPLEGCTHETIATVDQNLREAKELWASASASESDAWCSRLKVGRILIAIQAMLTKKRQFNNWLAANWDESIRTVYNIIRVIHAFGDGLGDGAKITVRAANMLARPVKEGDELFEAYNNARQATIRQISLGNIVNAKKAAELLGEYLPKGAAKPVNHLVFSAATRSELEDILVSLAGQVGGSQQDMVKRALGLIGASPAAPCNTEEAA